MRRLVPLAIGGRRGGHLRARGRGDLFVSVSVVTPTMLTREQRKAYDDSIKDDDDKGREKSFPSEEMEVEGELEVVNQKGEATVKGAFCVAAS